MLRPTGTISALWHKSKFNFILFEKKKSNFWVSMLCSSTREDLSIDVSITNVGLILAKPGRFLFSGYEQNSIWNFFEKKFNFWGFHAVVFVKTFPLMYQLQIIDVRVISFLGVRTDRQTLFWNPHMDTCRHTKNSNSMLKISV